MDSEPKASKKQNPRANANPLEALLFLNLFPIFFKFYKRELKEEDLFEVLDEHKASKLGDKLEGLWLEEQSKNKKCALHFALLRQFGAELITAGVIVTTSEVVSIAIIPLAIGGLVTYFQNAAASGEFYDGYKYASLICIGFAIKIGAAHPSLMWITHTCMKMRIACCSLIYRKCLRLNASALAQTTIGQIVNLISNDLSKFDQSLMYWYQIFAAPLQAVVGTYILYRQIGAAAFSGIAFMVLFVPLQIFLGRVSSKIRLLIATRTDERLRLMNEILNGISVIKMYTWEMPFANLVSAARRKEMKAIRAYYYITSFHLAMQFFVARISTFITILVFISAGNVATASIVYSIAALYNMLRPSLILLYFVACSSVADVYISINRIQTFISATEIKLKIDNESAFTQNENLSTPRIIFKDVSVKWVDKLPVYVLQNINLQIDKNQLVVLIGPVGSGKSTVFNVILKELPIVSGVLDVNGTISYASQDPWLFSSTVRQNILFGNEYNEDRYKTVLNVCALESDLRDLPNGDRTVISQSGRSLSGGQKARVNLARCIYKQADIYLLDDPLSAVDANVGKQLFEKCIKQFLANKICVLITHQLQYVKSADNIVVLDDGRIVGQGTYHALQNSGLDFASRLREYHTDNEQIKTIQTKQIIETPEKTEGSISNDKETYKTGRVGFETYQQYFKAGGNYFIITCLLLSFFAAYSVANFGDYYLALWANLNHKLVSTNETISYTGTKSFLKIYSGIIGLTVMLALAHSIFFFVFVTHASVNMHNSIFQKLTCASMQFFNSNPIGRILNRFSKDVGIVDEYIPKILVDVMSVTLVIAAAIIIALTVNRWLLFPFVVLLFTFYWVRRLYIATNRSAKRIEGIVRSPIFNHITASISGLSTIRAFRAEKTLVEEFDGHQDRHSSAWYIFFSSSRAFALWLDVLSIIFMAIVMWCLITINNDYHGGEVGLVLTGFISISALMQWGMRQWGELESNIISVERIFEYTKIQIEPIRDTLTLPKDWPENGKIVFQNVSMKYTINGPDVLKNLNLTINPSEKIGIVGRTGAGKTSIIWALFQLYNTEGSIIVDGVDITKLPLNDIRSKIAIIPQEPILFRATIRKNLDPFDKYNDDVLWNALEQVELKQIVEDLVGRLSSLVSESGSNFSVGQRQLICLARAIIRKNTILVMDEATANIDPYTDDLIQKTIRKEFAHCTVLTIAHRFHTIMDSDKVLVIDSGSIVEYDHPYNLLKNSDSLFYKMVEATGITATKSLYEIAKVSFEKISK